jgi:hypothetical protein
MSLTSVALTVHYLNVRQGKLGTTVLSFRLSTSYNMYTADKDSLPMEGFFKHNPNYFQLTQPGDSTFSSVLLPPSNIYGRHFVLFTFIY